MTIALAALVFLAQAQAGSGDLRARVEALPRPARAFVERRAECVHWMGEEPYDAARRREIDRALRKLRCGKIDRDEATLRRRHAADAEVLAVLGETRDLAGW